MPRRYTNDERLSAIRQVQARDGDIAQASAMTGVPVETLRRWWLHHREERARRLLARVERLHDQLAANAVHLALALDDSIDGAPLNQVATALGTVIDRYLKIHEHLGQQQAQQTQEEQVIRFEYQYPDGTIHPTAPWANPDYDLESAFSRGGLRSPLRENGGGQDDDYGAGSGTGRDVLVAGPDLPDGEPGVARFEDDLSAFTRIDD